MAQLDLPQLTVSLGGQDITFPTLSTSWVRPNLEKCPLNKSQNNGKRNSCDDVILGPGKADQIFRSGGVASKVSEFMTLANIELGKQNFLQVRTEAQLLKEYLLQIQIGAKEFVDQMRVGANSRFGRCCYSNSRWDEYRGDYESFHTRVKEQFGPYYRWVETLEPLQEDVLDQVEFQEAFSQSQIVLAQAQQQMQKSSEQTFNIRLRRFLIVAGVILAAFLIYKFVFKKK
jgi:hypothetical protein